MIALSYTGLLADEISRDFDFDCNCNKLITVVSANAEERIIDALQTALSVKERSVGD